MAHKLINIISLMISVTQIACGTTINGSATGTAGANGANGTNGTNGVTVTSSIVCSHFDNTTQFTYQYTREIYSNGDNLVICSMLSDSLQFTNTQLLRSGQTGASNGLCTIRHDMDTPSQGEFDFTQPVSNNVPQVVYVDSGSTQNNYTITYTVNTECTKI